MTLNQQEFRRVIEQSFLPYAVKPARFLATEWRNGSASKNAPLAVIVSGASYESSLTNPLSSAVFEAALDSRICDIGWLYQFGDESQMRLSNVGAAPFVTPQLVQLTDAELIFVPISRPAEVFSALRNLIQAGIVFGEGSGTKKDKNSQPKIIAVTDNKSCHVSLSQKILDEVFDRVFSLSELQIALESMKKNGSSLIDLVNLPVVEANIQSERRYFPANPPGPVVEVSQNRACFRFAETPALFEQADDSAESSQGEASGQAIASAIIDSGQTEFQIERCYRAGAQIDIAEALDMISVALIPERYRVSLSEISWSQLSGRLPGALRRYRGARIDIKAPSLSDTVNRALARPFDIASLIESLRNLQRPENVQIQLTVSLGYPGDSEIEVAETIQSIRSFSQALNPRSGLKIRFVHFTPQTAGANPADPVRGIQEVQEMFESVRRRKSRGIALTFLDPTPYLLDVLIGNGAFSTLSALISFALDLHRTVKRDSAGMIELLNPYQKYFSADLPQIETAQHTSHIPEKPCLHSLESVCDFSVQPPDVDNDFGRVRKRSGGAGGGVVAAPTKTRVRFTWKISSPARFLSHLDNLRALEGALLRSRLLLSYTQGVRPRPKVSFGPPLPVGFTSDCELFDAFFELAPTTDELERLFRSLPGGFEITRHETVYTKALSILEEVSAASYIVRLPLDNSAAVLSEKLKSALSAPRLIYQRKTKSGVKDIDLRPGVFAAEIDQSADQAPIALKLTLALTDTFTIRPEDFLRAVGIIESEAAPELIIHRTKFHFGRMPAFRRQVEIVNEKVVSEEV